MAPVATLAKVASPQPVLENETVAMSCNKSDAQSIPTGSVTDLIYSTTEFDTHNAYDTSTGQYTVPVTGFYSLDARVLFASTADWDAGNLGYIRVEVNGTLKKTGQLTEWQTSNSTSVYLSSGVQCLLSLSKGDVVTIAVYQHTGGSLDTFNQNDDNYFNIHKVK